MSGFYVLMYHELIRKADLDRENKSRIRVAQEYRDILPGPLFVCLEAFEKQMAYLYENGYSALKLQDVIDFYQQGKALPEKSVLITFDDMYKSARLYAYPVLKQYGFPAVGFVVEDWLFTEPEAYSSSESVCLSKGELEEMADVFEYANHSKALHTRKDGITALQAADKQAFFEDAEACEQYTGRKKVYAYPFGIFTEENVAWLRELGFKLAFTTQAGKNTAASDPLKLCRNGVFLDDDLDRFRNLLER